MHYENTNAIAVKAHEALKKAWGIKTARALQWLRRLIEGGLTPGLEGQYETLRAVTRKAIF